MGSSSQKRTRAEDDSSREEEVEVALPAGSGIICNKNNWRAPAWRPHQLTCYPTHHVSHRPIMGVVILREASGVSAEIYLYGAHVTSWKNEEKEELLFVSKKATFKPPKPIHGGISICIPQFCNHKIPEALGSARNRVWSVDPNPPPFPIDSPNKSFVDLLLKPSEEDLKIFFEFHLRVTLGPGGNLTLTSGVKNIGSKKGRFTFAYHTHFSVSDISDVRVERLDTLLCVDNVKGTKLSTDQGHPITFEGEVNMTFHDTPKILVMDHFKRRTFQICKDGLPDAVVWNPGGEKAKAMADFGDDEYKHMLCVEAAAIENPIKLKPGYEWKGWQELSAIPSILGT